MNETAYAVLLHGKRVGAIYRRDRFTKFVFDPGYWDQPARAVLGRWFEDHPRKQPRANNRVPAWFSNLLPEGRLRRLIAQEQGISVYQEADLLECIGHDLPGAVEVRQDPDATVGAALLETVDDASSGAAPPEGSLRFSLAGMALKFSMRQEGDRLALPAHGQDGDWIVKTPDRNYPGLPANERSVMELARAVGIEVPRTALRPRDSLEGIGPELWSSEETQAYAVCRFDRSAAGRIHMEDFAQVLGRHGSGDGKYCSNVETVAGLAYRGQDHGSLQEMVRRTVFNLLVGNGDAHLKNWSLVYPDKRNAQLSPAYDLVCTAVFPGQAELGLPFFGAERLSKISRTHFARLQESLKVNHDDVLDVVDETIERFFQAWGTDTAEQMPPSVSDWIKEHLEQTSRQLTQE